MIIINQPASPQKEKRSTGTFHPSSLRSTGKWLNYAPSGPIPQSTLGFSMSFLVQKLDPPHFVLSRNSLEDFFYCNFMPRWISCKIAGPANMQST